MKARRWRPSWVAIALGALAALPVLAWAIAYVWSENALRRELERIRAAGKPLTLTDARPQPVPDDQNAALVYSTTFDLTPHRYSVETSFLRKQDGSRREVPVLSGSGAWPLEEARATLSTPDVRSALDALRRAAERPYCVFDLPPTDVPFPGRLSFSAFRDAARWLTARARLSARDGKTDEALDWCRVALRTSEHMAQERSVVAQLSVVAVQQMVNFTVRDALVAAPPSPEAAAQFVAYLDSIDRRAEYRLAAELERAWTITWCDLLRQRPSPLLEAAEGWSTGDPLDVWAVRHYASWPGRPFLNMGETHYLRGMSGYLNALDVPPGRAGEAYEAIDAAVARMPTGSLWWLMSGDVLGNLPRHRDKSATELALMQVAVALEVQRARDGVYPETLAELDALPRFTVPADPFTGAPLHYRRTARGFLLWSVGPDLDDDGGEGMWADLGGRPSRRHWPDADVAWEVAR